MTVETRLVTADELEHWPATDDRIELVKGVIVRMPPAGHEHGRRAGGVVTFLVRYRDRNPIGFLYLADTGFILSRDPDTVRAPDAAFVREERAAEQARKEGFFQGAPDLAVEIVSPDESAADVQEKVLDYLTAGTRAVWVFYPKTRTIAVHRSLQSSRTLTVGDVLDGEDVLPGFSVAVRDLFD